MEDHFLKDFVTDATREKPGTPWYSRTGDCIIYQVADEAVVAERIDEVLTIYRSAIDNRPIGCQIKGVGAILKKFGLAGIGVELADDGKELTEVSIFAWLLAAYESGPKTISRRLAYAEAFGSCARKDIHTALN